MSTSVTDLLPAVRRVILDLRARETGPCSFGLSWLTWKLGPIRSGRSAGLSRSHYTSGGLKSIRGRAQACLAILAREGIMYGRTHPERGIQRYEHGETDKRFRVRITQAEAVRRLAAMRPN